MEPAEEGEPHTVPAKPAGILRQGVRFTLHLLAVYLIVQFLTMWVAGRVHDFILPFVQQHQPTVSYFQFAFSHLFAFTFFPGLAVGFMYSEWFRHRAALIVWIVPLAVLAYKFATFPSSLFQNHFVVAFHEYFASGFMIPEFHSYHELFEVVGESRIWHEACSNCTTRLRCMQVWDMVLEHGCRFDSGSTSWTRPCRA